MLIEVEYRFATRTRTVFVAYETQVKEVGDEYDTPEGKMVSVSDFTYPSQLYYRPHVGEYVESECGTATVKIFSVTHKVKQKNKKTILVLEVE